MGMGFAARYSSPGLSLWCRTRGHLPKPALAQPAASHGPFAKQRSGCSRTSHLSRPSLDVCPFLSTSTPLESQPFCCAYASHPKSGVPSPTSLSEGKLLPPPTSQCSSPLHSTPRLSLRPRFSPVLAGLVAIAFVGHGQRMRSQHLGLPLAWPLAPQVRGQTQLPLHTPGPSSCSFCCPLSSAESAREDRAPRGLTPALAAAQPDGKRHIDARCSLRL